MHTRRAIKATLICGCRRVVSTRVAPTKHPARPGSVACYLRRLLAVHVINVESLTRVLSTNPSFPFLSIQRPFHFNDRLQDLSLNTSPGLRAPYRTKAECLKDPKYTNFLRDYQHRIKDRRRRRPLYATVPSKIVATPHAKFDVSSGTIKTRYAVVVPLPILAIENMFIRPFLDALPADYVPTPFNRHHNFCGGRSYGTDLKDSDTSIHRALLLCGLSVIRRFLRFDHYQGGSVPDRGTSLEQLWDYYVDYVTGTPIEIDGVIYHCKHGIPSGILATNLLTSIINVLCMTAANVGKDFRLSQYGDNSVLRNGYEFEHVRKFYASLGLTIKHEPPNEHGCITYNKAECHLGVPFHDGSWYSNILNCVNASLRGLVAICLLYSEPTKQQYDELCETAELYGVPRRINERFATFIGKWFEYGMLKGISPL